MIKKIVTKTLKWTTITALLVALLGGGWFYYTDSMIKGDFFYAKAVSLDEADDSGSIKAVRFYNKAIRVYERLAEKEKAVRAYINLALLHYKFGNIMQVEFSMLRALKLGSDTLPDNLKAKSYLLLASTSEPVKAKEYIDQAQEIAKRLSLYPELAKSYYLLGRIEELKANFRVSEKNYLKAIDILQTFPSTVYFVNTVSLYEHLGELYAGDGRTRKAIKYYNEALAYSYREGDTLEVARFMRLIGDLYQEKREYAKACEFWRKSQEEYALLGHGKSVNEKYFEMPEPCRKIG